jgi:hypothetical protein
MKFFKFWLLSLLGCVLFPILTIAISTGLTAAQVFPTDITVTLLAIQLISIVSACIFYYVYLTKKTLFLNFSKSKTFFLMLLTVGGLTQLTTFFYNLTDSKKLLAFFCDSLEASSTCLAGNFIKILDGSINLWIYPLVVMEVIFLMYIRLKPSPKEKV